MTCEKTNMRGSSAPPAQSCIFSIEKPVSYWARTTTKADIEREPAALIRINAAGRLPTRFVYAEREPKSCPGWRRAPRGVRQERGRSNRRPLSFSGTDQRQPRACTVCGLGFFGFSGRSAPFGFIARLDQFFHELLFFVGRHPGLVARRRLVLELGISASFRDRRSFSPHSRDRETRQQ